MDASGPRPHRRTRLLWIDDELGADCAEIRLLSMCDVDVDSATTGSSGLALAATGLHDAIILDLRLPDIDGVDLLFRLRMDGCRLPVLVLSGWADVPSTVAVMRLGASDVLSKPIDIETIQQSLLMLVHGRETPPAPSNGDAPGRDILRALLDVVATATSQEAVQLAVVRALLNRHTTLTDFFFCAGMLRALAAPGLPVLECRAIVRAKILEAVEFPLRDHPPQVSAALALLAGCDRRRSESSIAEDLGVERAYLSRLVADTGVTFREWRRAALIRAALPRLLETRARVTEVADALGYSHASLFDRDFKDVCGLTPRELRLRWLRFS